MQMGGLIYVQFALTLEGASLYLLDRRLGKFQSRSGRLGENTNLLLLLGI